jgi:hypothetical protein
MVKENHLDWIVVLKGKLDETRCSDSIFQTKLMCTEMCTTDTPSPTCFGSS